MAREQARSDFGKLRLFNNLQCMYTTKKKKERGRCLPGGQLPAARAQAFGAVRAKGWKRRGAAACDDGDDNEDDDGDEDEDEDGGWRGGEGEAPQLPHGDGKKFQWQVPAAGPALIGWVVMAYFPEDQVWASGVVVGTESRHGALWLTVFHEQDNFHEEWKLPDNELVFRCVSAGSHKVKVSPNMLPRL